MSNLNNFKPTDEQIDYRPRAMRQYDNSRGMEYFLPSIINRIFNQWAIVDGRNLGDLKWGEKEWVLVVSFSSFRVLFLDLLITKNNRTSFCTRLPDFGHQPYLAIVFSAAIIVTSIVMCLLGFVIFIDCLFLHVVYRTFQLFAYKEDRRREEESKDLI